MTEYHTVMLDYQNHNGKVIQERVFKGSKKNCFEFVENHQSPDTRFFKEPYQYLICNDDLDTIAIYLIQEGTWFYLEEKFDDDKKEFARIFEDLIKKLHEEEIKDILYCLEYFREIYNEKRKLSIGVSDGIVIELKFTDKNKMCYIHVPNYTVFLLNNDYDKLIKYLQKEIEK